MFLGYQNNKIAFVAKTKEDLENMACIVFDKIEETDKEYALFEGEYLLQSDIALFEQHKKAILIREKRDSFLQETDKKMLIDYPIDDGLRELYKNYRQYLRDVPTMDNFPDVEVLSFDEWNK